MMNQTGHIDQIKQLNTGIVYQVIDQHGPISRIALSKHAQLAPASITKITRELMDAHLIKELEFPVLGLRGRPAVGLVIESAGWQFLSVRIENNNIILSLNEMNTKTLAENKYPFLVNNNDDFLSLISELISQFFESHQSLLERVTAISILLDGIIDSHTGIIYKLAGYQVNKIQISEYLTSKTGLPVYLNPVVNALALTDCFSNSPKRINKNIIYLQLQEVVSTAIVNYGQVLDVNRGRPILFGHTQLGENNERLCYCGGQDCLETYVSMPAIIEQAKMLLPDYPLSILNHNELTVDTICNGILCADKLSLYLLETVAKQLSKPLSMMINIFGTDLILINSPLNTVSAIFFDYLHQFINLQSSPLYSSNLQIEKSNFSTKDSETALIQQSLYDGSLLLQLLQG